MSIKFLRSAANQYLSAPDSAAQTFPNSDWSLSWVTVFDGLVTGDNPQYMFSTGAIGTAGVVEVFYFTNGAATSPGKVIIWLDTNTSGTSPNAQSSTAFSSGAYLFTLQRSGTTLTLRHCPVLSSAPTDGSAVIADSSTTWTGALDGPSGLFIGGRADLNAARFCDQSLARFVRYDGALTDLEVAKLAYGMEITDLGKTPAWYVKMDTVSDITDRGTQANTFTPHGAIATGTAPGFGYTAAATAAAITSSPVIVGGANVGSASSVTPGSTTGSPTPTNTFQWNLNGVAVSGATGTTYTPVSGDVGKTLTVTQTASNGVGTPATATSAGVVVAAATSTIDVTQLAAESVYQRSGTSLAIPLVGTYTLTTPTSIEYQLYAEDGTTVLVAWTAIAGATISGGNWSGTPTMPQGGMYRLAVRSKNGTTVLATSNIKANLFGIGDLIGHIGSSSVEKAYQNFSGTGFTAAANVRRHQSGAWSKFSTDGCAILIANSLAAQAGVPIGMLGYGVGGDTLAIWINTSSSSWVAFANAVAAVGGKLAGFIVSVGSNDAGNGIVVSRAQHLANMRTLIANTRSITGQPNLPCAWSGFNRRRADQVTTAQADFVRMAEDDIEADSNVCHIQTLDFELTDDLVHLSPNTNGFPASGLRTAFQGGRLFYNGTKVHGPKITSITYTSSAITLTVLHRNGNALTPASGINGVAASDSSGALTFSSVAAINATQIVATPTRAIVGTPVVTHLSGPSPVSATTAAPTNEAFDNGATPLPMTVEANMVATAASALATTLTFPVAKDLAGTPADNATGLDYSIYESTRLNANVLPIKYGTLSIVNGNVTLDITGATTLSPGGTVRINYGPSDGSKVASALVTVS